jgi:iron complex outermembrane receptor protein
MNDPHHIFGLRTAVDLPRSVELDAVLRSVSELPAPVVPGYAEMTLRLGWTATPRMEVWIVGHDLLHDRHPEFGAATPLRVELERGVRIGTTFRF